MQQYKYNGTNAKVQTQKCKRKSANAKVQMQKCKCKNADAKMQTQNCSNSNYNNSLICKTTISFKKRKVKVALAWIRGNKRNVPDFGTQ